MTILAARYTCLQKKSTSNYLSKRRRKSWVCYILTTIVTNITIIIIIIIVINHHHLHHEPGGDFVLLDIILYQNAVPLLGARTAARTAAQHVYTTTVITSMGPVFVPQVTRVNSVTKVSLQIVG